MVSEGIRSPAAEQVRPDLTRPPASAIRRILVLPGTYDCGNVGDLAMLQVAVERLRDLWPSATLHVLTHDPAALTASCPGVDPVPLRGRNRWLRIRALPRWLFPHVPSESRRRFPLPVRRAWKLGMFLSPSQYRITRQFVAAMFNADLLVMTGCGGLADVFWFNAVRILDTFDVAQRCGIPTAMFSQGLGPAEHPRLLERAREVLPRLGALFVRERRAALPFLARLGVPAASVQVTGDDAVELAFRERRPDVGSHLGLNLRVARYASMDERVRGPLQQVLVEKAQRVGARVLGVPISCRGVGCDREMLGQLLAGGAVGDAGEDLRTPVEVVRRVGECRVVVTGSYHGGVFALSQGIPAVCLAASAYYQDKFLGLADQFGAGCVVLRFDEPDWVSRLRAALDELWLEAPALRAPLLLRAEQQVKDARAAYAALPALISAPARAAGKQGVYSGEA